MMKATPQPPGWATRLLNWLHPDETLEEVEGNLEELYAYWYEQSGKRHATLRYVLNVLSVLRQFVSNELKKSLSSIFFYFILICFEITLKLPYATSGEIKPRASSI